MTELLPCLIKRAERKGDYEDYLRRLTTVVRELRSLVSWREVS